jgi:hypothetical protein
MLQNTTRHFLMALLGYTNSSDDVKKRQQAFLVPLPGIGFISILSNDVKKFQQAFLVPLPRTDVVVIFEPGLLVYL